MHGIERGQTPVFLAGMSEPNKLKRKSLEEVVLKIKKQKGIECSRSSEEGIHRRAVTPIQFKSDGSDEECEVQPDKDTPHISESELPPNTESTNTIGTDESETLALSSHHKNEEVDKNEQGIEPETPSCSSKSIKEYKCDTCGSEYKSLKSLTRHKNEKHKDVVEKFKCPVSLCDREFKRKDQLNGHLKKDHSVENGLVGWERKNRSEKPCPEGAVKSDDTLYSKDEIEKSYNPLFVLDNSAKNKLVEKLEHLAGWKRIRDNIDFLLKYFDPSIDSNSDYPYGFFYHIHKLQNLKGSCKEQGRFENIRKLYKQLDLS